MKSLLKFKQLYLCLTFDWIKHKSTSSSSECKLFIFELSEYIMYVQDFHLSNNLSNERELFKPEFNSQAAGYLVDTVDLYREHG